MSSVATGTTTSSANTLMSLSSLESQAPLLIATKLIRTVALYVMFWFLGASGSLTLFSFSILGGTALLSTLHSLFGLGATAEVASISTILPSTTPSISSSGVPFVRQNWLRILIYSSTITLSVFLWLFSLAQYGPLRFLWKGMI